MLYNPLQHNAIRLIAFDLDGTLSQHKSKLGEENRAVLDRLAERYRLLMVGAGSCRRIFEQMNRYPIDIIGNYGMEGAVYDADARDIRMDFTDVVPCDHAEMEARITMLRREFGFTEYKGNNVEFHASGCVTFPILGTQADLADKLVFDPDRAKRRPLLARVREVNPDFNVFVGGTSSFDMSPGDYNKYKALDRYCQKHGYAHNEVLFVGDDFGEGGNDESVYVSDIPFRPIDDYRRFGALMQPLL